MSVVSGRPLGWHAKRSAVGSRGYEDTVTGPTMHEPERPCCDTTRLLMRGLKERERDPKSWLELNRCTFAYGTLSRTAKRALAVASAAQDRLPP